MKGSLLQLNALSGFFCVPSTGEVDIFTCLCILIFFFFFFAVGLMIRTALDEPEMN